MVTKKRAKRGRPREFDIEAAVAIAANLFHQRGYDGIGIAELSETIGITAPSLYSAFGSKRELFERSLKHYVQMNGGWLPEALSSEEDLAAAIDTLFNRAADVYAANDECLGCLVIDGTRNCRDAEAQKLTASFRRATWGMVRDRIQSGAPGLAKAQIDALADYAVMILVGLSGSARDGMTTEALRTTAKIAAIGFKQQLDFTKNN
ncbi:MAG: TetR/AcrR family transcriptional regulator [Phormidesmis sp.]